MSYKGKTDAEYHKEWRLKNPQKTSEYLKKYRERHPGRGNRQVKEYKLRARLEVLAHYSNGNMNCACCGESNVEFLGIDHINGNGAEERRKVGGGNNIYTYLRTRGLPLGYRVLCHNCNMSIGFYGYCPHMEVPLALNRGRDNRNM